MPPRATWPPERIALLERSAADFLDPTIPEELDVDAAFRMLSGPPNGPERLFDIREENERPTSGFRGAGRRSLELATERRRWASNSSSPACRRSSSGWRWTTPGCQGNVVIRCFPGPRNPDWLKAQRTGSDSPIVAASRSLLERHPGRLDYYCLALFADSGPIAERDVETIVAALDRLLQHFRTNYEWSSVKPQGSLAEAHAKLFDRLKTYSARPSVRKLFERRRELEAEGILR